MGVHLRWKIFYMIGIDSSKYRYGFASGNVYRSEEGSGLEVRNLKSGCWERSRNPSLITCFMFGKGVLLGGSEEADKIFRAVQASLKKTS